MFTPFYLLRVLSEDFPHWHLLSELLIDDHYNTHDVRWGGGGGLEDRQDSCDMNIVT